MKGTCILCAVLISFFLVPFNGYSETTDELLDKIIDARQNSRFEEALYLAEECIKQLPNNPFGYNEKGSALSSLNREEEAIEFYTKALDFAKGDKTIIMRNIALQYKITTKFTAAIEWHKKAIEENPDMFALDMLGIADIYLLKGDIEAALSAYENAKPKIELSEAALSRINETNKGIAYSIAAAIAYLLGKDSDALEFSEKAKNLKGTDAYKLSFATYLAETGHKGRAKMEFSLIQPDNCDALDVAIYYLLIDDTENALSFINKSYADQKSSEQVSIWRNKLKILAAYPKDRLKKARNQEWLKSKMAE